MRKMIVMATVAGAFAIGGGAALATIPDSNGTIHGRHNPQGNSMSKLNDRYRSPWTNLPKGIDSTQLEPDRATRAEQCVRGACRQTTFSSQNTLILSKTVPAGSYVINAKTMLTNLNQSNPVHVNPPAHPRPPSQQFRRE